jgi:hypothetical protein
MRTRTAFLLICIGWVVCVAGRFVSAVDDPPPVRRISVDELASGKTVIIGRLGVPLMTTVTIRGTWHRPVPLSTAAEQPRKENEPRFHVEEVDGKALDQPVRFHRAVVSVSADYKEQSSGKVLKPRDGETWELIAHETGRFHSPPDPAMQEPIWNAGRFSTGLSGVLRTPEAEKYESERKDRLKAGNGR